MFTVYKWSFAGTISENTSEPYVLWGILALVCFDFLGFFSIKCVRTKSYNLFFGTHVMGLTVTLFAVGGSYPPLLAQLTAAVL